MDKTSTYLSSSKLKLINPSWKENTRWNGDVSIKYRNIVYNILYKKIGLNKS